MRAQNIIYEQTEKGEADGAARELTMPVISSRSAVAPRRAALLSACLLPCTAACQLPEALHALPMPRRALAESLAALCLFYPVPYERSAAPRMSACPGCRFALQPATL